MPALSVPVSPGTSQRVRSARDMDIGALPRRCRPFSLMESGPLKSKTQQLNASAHSPFAHERQCEALGFMDQPFQVHMTRAPLAKQSTAWRVFMPAAFASRASLSRMWEALSRTILELRLALVSEARSLGYAVLAS